VLQLEDAIMKRVDGDLGAVAPAGAAFVLLSPKPAAASCACAIQAVCGSRDAGDQTWTTGGAPADQDRIASV
jgi:hypothetical protein